MKSLIIVRIKAIDSTYFSKNIKNTGYYFVIKDYTMKVINKDTTIELVISSINILITYNQKGNNNIFIVCE